MIELRSYCALSRMSMVSRPHIYNMCNCPATQRGSAQAGRPRYLRAQLQNGTAIAVGLFCTRVLISACSSGKACLLSVGQAKGLILIVANLRSLLINSLAQEEVGHLVRFLMECRGFAMKERYF